MVRFSIVTPVYNGEAYIAKTIESVLSQEGDFEIEYIIQDGGSSDGTEEIVLNYQRLLADQPALCKCSGVHIQYYKERDGGMYDAINKGFIKATGTIYAWINADDIYVPGAFQTISKIFTRFADIDWVGGICRPMDASGGVIQSSSCYLFRRDWIEAGIYGREGYFIPQDAQFWRPSLWERVGGLNATYRYAGDYDVWIRFARHAKLYSLNKHVSHFRKHPYQLSKSIEKYKAEQQRISPRSLRYTRLRLFFFLESRLRRYAMIERVLLAIYKSLFLTSGDVYIEEESSGSYRIRRFPSFKV